MFTILQAQENFSAKNSDRDSIEVLIDDAVSSLLPPQKNHRNFIEIQWWKGSCKLVSDSPLGYQNADVLQLISDYISNLKLEIQQNQCKQNPQNILKIQIKSAELWRSEKNSLAKFETSELKITQARLIELLQEEDEDEYGILKPTPYAFDKAWHLVLAASQLMRNSFKRASVSTDAEGGIRLTWTKQQSEAEVRLICPGEPNKQIYLYHEKGSEYDVVKDVSGFTLASWLHWLNQV